MKLLTHSWGKEYILHIPEGVVRIYSSKKKTTIDLTQIHDTNGTIIQQIHKKYGTINKIILEPKTDEEVLAIVKWFNKKG